MRQRLLFCLEGAPLTQKPKTATQQVRQHRDPDNLTGLPGVLEHDSFPGGGGNQSFGEWSHNCKVTNSTDFPWVLQRSAQCAEMNMIRLFKPPPVFQSVSYDAANNQGWGVANLLTCQGPRVWSFIWGGHKTKGE